MDLLTLGSVGVGRAYFLALLWHRIQRSRQRRTEREVERPFQGALLRPVGHHLQENLHLISAQQDDESSRGLLAACLAGALAVPSVSVSAALLALPKATQFSTSLIVVLGIAGSVLCGVRALQGIRKLCQLREKAINLRLGLRGEQAVAEVLHSPEVVRAGFYAFHDVPADRLGNLDHVVLGPGGIFVIETKARSRQKPKEKQARHVVEFDGQALSFPWGYRDFDAPAQVNRAREWMEGWAAKISPELSVEALLVLPGWDVKSTTRTKLKAMSANYLRSYLASLPPRMKPEELEPLRAFLDRQCRTVHA